MVEPWTKETSARPERTERCCLVRAVVTACLGTGSNQTDSMKELSRAAALSALLADGCGAGGEGSREICSCPTQSGMSSRANKRRNRENHNRRTCQSVISFSASVKRPSTYLL